MDAFDAAAWVAAFEAAGGFISVEDWHDGTDGLLLRLDLPGDGRGRGGQLHQELHAEPGSAARLRAVTDLIATTRGVLDLPDA